MLLQARECYQWRALGCAKTQTPWLFQGNGGSEQPGLSVSNNFINLREKYVVLLANFGCLGTLCVY